MGYAEMDSDALKTFIAIRDAGGFSRAADLLGRSQPAISRRMALLEEELGVSLFDRVAGGVVLSEAGRVLAPYAERALAALGDCGAAVKALHSAVSGPLAIAVVGTLASANLTPVLRRFALAHPDVALSVRTAASAEVSNLVRRGEVTLGLRYHHDAAPDLTCDAVGAERLHVVCPIDHPRAGLSVASLRDLGNEHWLAFPNAPEMREASANHLFAQFLVRGIAEVSWTPVDSLTAQKRMVEAGFGIALMPESASIEEIAQGGLATIAVSDMNAANAVYLVSRRGGYISAAAEALIQLLRAAPVVSLGGGKEDR
jgi:DNA-binding transcriptional LysR family regulator